MTEAEDKLLSILGEKEYIRPPQAFPEASQPAARPFITALIWAWQPYQGFPGSSLPPPSSKAFFRIGIEQVLSPSRGLTPGTAIDS